MLSDILFVSYYFPPINSIAVKRNYHIAMELKSHFSKVHILTTTNQNFLSLSEQPLQGLDIHLLHTWDYRRIIHFFRKKSDTHFAESKKSSFFAKTIIRLNESLPFNIFFGEGGLAYIINGYFKGSKLLGQSNDTFIYASYRPTANVLIGYLLKTRFPEARWVVNFHDIPVDDVRQNVVFPRFQDWCWKKILLKCDLVVPVSEGVAMHLRKYTDKVHVLHNGVLLRKSRVAKNNRFTISYTGSLYHDYRHPGLLLDVLAAWINAEPSIANKIRIQYAGKDSIQWQKWMTDYGLESISIVKGTVSPSQALEIQEESHVNLLLTWTSEQQSGILTGKLFEYLGASNAVLAIVNGVKDAELEAMFALYNCGKVCYREDVNASIVLKNWIKQLLNDWETGNYKEPFCDQDTLSQLNWENQVQQMMDKIHADS